MCYTMLYRGNDVVAAGAYNHAVGRFHFASGLDANDGIQSIKH